MKKTLLFSLALGIGTVATAQRSPIENHKLKEVNAKMTVSEDVTITPLSAASFRSPSAIIWSENFDAVALGSIPTGWSTAGGFPAWRKTLKGSSGSFAGTTPIVINSTTKTGGFLIYDADSLNTFLHPQPTPPNGSGYQALDGAVVTDTIDLTGHPNVRLEFQQVFRLCCALATADVIVSVSGNGGTTWTDYSVRGTTGINAVSQNPNIVSLNISPVAGNSANVMVKFNFTSGSGTYYWQVDDVQIIDNQTNELQLEKTYSDFNYQDGGYYGYTPVLQTGPITFRGAVVNEGIAAQTNVNMTVAISGAGTNSQTSNTISSLPSLGRDTLYASTAYTPSTIGAYTTVFTVNQSETDEAPANNTVTRIFNVSDTVYARDLGVTTTGNVRNLSTNQYVGGGVDESTIANLYEFPAATNITSASAYISSASAIGTSFDFVLYSVDASGNLSNPFVASSDIYTIASAADKDKWVTLPFINGNYPVLAGESYYIGVRCYGQGTGVSLYVLSDLNLETLQPSATTIVNFNAGDPAQWGLIGASSPFIRLNVEGPVGINENSIENGIVLSQNIPNPASDNTTINFNISKSDKVSITVYDISGKLVATIDKGQLTAGNHSVVLNVKNFDAGMYFYTLTVGENRVTKKMIIK